MIKKKISLTQRLSVLFICLKTRGNCLCDWKKNEKESLLVYFSFVHIAEHIYFLTAKKYSQCEH